MTDVTIRLLGGFSVRAGGEEVSSEGWPTRAAQLVQLLALAEGHRLPREQVIDALWPRLGPQAGGANLRKAAHFARQVLRSPDAVVLHAGQVLLFPSRALLVDTERFERLARKGLADKDPRLCAEAADAYAGELLPGAPYDEWIGAARTRLHALLLETLRAGALWERLAQIEPTDEAAHRALMHRELAAGNRPAALRWYSRLRSALQQALGVAPDRETQALYDECVAGLRPAGPAFVGRQAELALATAWLRERANLRAGGLVIRGPAGIGKSAFSRQVAALAREQGWTVVRIEAAQPDRPYAVVSGTIEDLLAQDRSRLDAVGASAAAVLAALTPAAVPAQPLQGPLGRHQVIGALRRLLLAASKEGPVMLQVDDAHLMEQADADALLQLAATGRPVYLVLATRPLSEDSPLAAGLRRLIGARQLLPIELAALEEEDARRLVQLATDGALEEGVLEQVVRLAEGNPFAAIELARSMGAAGAARLPADLREAITARLADVGAEALALLECLALAGDGFETGTILALSTYGEEKALALVDEALAAGTLVVAGTRYRFRHELVRQALVEQIAPHQRLKLHRDAARRLALARAPAALVARHWLSGGSPVEATPWLLAAAREALRVGAFADVLPSVDPVLAYEPGHVEGLRLRAEALDARGDPAALPAYRAAADAAGKPAADDLLAKAALAQVKLGDPKGALQVLAGLTPSTVEGRLAEALAYSGAAALGVADPAMGTRKAAEARKLALQAGDTAAIVVASWAQAAAAHARGELHHSVWADLQDTCNRPHLAVRLFDGQLCITQRFLYGARPYPEVIAFTERLAEEARRLGAARAHAFAVTLRGEAELLAGDLEGAQEHLTLGASLHRAIGGPTGEAFSLQRLAELSLYRGEREAARERLDQALDVARQTDIGFHLLDRIYGTRIALAAGPESALAALEDAQESVRGPLETCPGCRITFAVPAAIAAARAGRLPLAEQYERACEYLANVVMRLPAWYAALDEVRAHLARARGEDEEQVRARFLSAAHKFRQAGQPLDAARCETLAVTAR